MRIRHRGDDEGFTLIEMVVTTTIMTFVTLMIVSATTEMYSMSNKTEQQSYAREQIDTSFRRLDSDLRYAIWINTPAQVGTRWYMEYQRPTRDAAGALVLICRQLKLENGVLSLATWSLPSTTPGTPSTIASEITVTAGVAPFTLYATGSFPYASASPNTAGVGRNFSPERQQVRFRFSAKVGTVTVPLDVVFSALNNTRNTSSINDCSKGRPTV
ncbi:prepilin-type N-terminal cleavage/methylation domain-containing protein [Actinoplanes sp. NBRC 101535]|uniref:PulJ/GspJ family protein n=1 Tax=Actinoplanes sp. NBRC 101535 TaxID=3032196 RepID=UPI0024A45724|nr:prepilin-type N-terminal cleavage/methylation domain-containing protein [Actinoplanes sp. NBRC 101535]GLY05560.1 hypothetical protein Acsp01_59390 [Actinoplanes sp. NBRC 101535]